MMPDRANAVSDFLKSAGWGEAKAEAFPGDASTRSYTRLHLGEQRAILMDAPAGAEAPACPPDASAEERNALGYNALARLAGPNLAAFAGLTQELRTRGFSAPEIYAADLPAGFLLLEDLDDAIFANIIAGGADEADLYSHAVDALAAIYRSSFPAQLSAFGGDWHIMDYDAPALLAETHLLLDWYVPHFSGEAVNTELRAAWDETWTRAFGLLDGEAHGLALRDFHAENLIWLPERSATARVGLIDYQDALFAHPAYDLVSLLEDARRDVPQDLAAEMKARFLDRAYIADREAFDAAYALLGAQRNAKILGIFVRLAQRDGKPRYLDLIPRVAAHFRNDLSHPALSDVRMLVQSIRPELAHAD